MACCWGEVVYAMGPCLVQSNSPECLGHEWIPPWSSYGMKRAALHWAVSPWISWARKVWLSSAKMKRSLAGVWKHSLLAVHLLLWAAWERFPHPAKEEPPCRVDSKQPQDEVCAHNQEKIRSEQNKGVDLMGSFPATRAWSGLITEYLQTLNQCLLSWPSCLLNHSCRLRMSGKNNRGGRIWLQAQRGMPGLPCLPWHSLSLLLPCPPTFWLIQPYCRAQDRKALLLEALYPSQFMPSCT